jgi:hypothetical protein
MMMISLNDQFRKHSPHESKQQILWYDVGVPPSINYERICLFDPCKHRRLAGLKNIFFRFSCPLPGKTRSLNVGIWKQWNFLTQRRKMLFLMKRICLVKNNIMVYTCANIPVDSMVPSSMTIISNLGPVIKLSAVKCHRGLDEFI